MSRFVFDESDDLTFNSPQEMYEDYKKKKIKGVLDYQAEILTNYVETCLPCKDVALELPTGSGKTLVGLLIAEFRRRKYNEKIVYVCPNNQLVNQVVTQATDQYDIPTIGFTGSRADYSQEQMSSYTDCSKIAVTNYSSIFNTNSFFNNADVVIFDDAHSAEGYIAKNWTVTINRINDSELFNCIVERLKEVISNSSYLRLTEDLETHSEENWCDMIPRIKLFDLQKDLIDIIDPRVLADTSKKYSWGNIKYNLEACNVYLSKHNIMIRPLIPPTNELSAFSNPKQRIYMSATLGTSGELERTVGVGKIKRLTLAENRVPSIGRRFFIFPNVKFEQEHNFEIFSKIKEQTPRALILTESGRDMQRLKDDLIKNSHSRVYGISDLDRSLDDFSVDSDAVAVLANRYDGLNMQDDLCHFLIIHGLPSTIGLQEKFFTTKLSTAVLFDERMKTRITQAVGRCTRTTTDYAVVMIIGRELQNIMSPNGKANLFSPELRAEIETGYSVSNQMGSVEDMIETAQLGFTRDGDWNEIDAQIIKKRNQYRKEDSISSCNEELLNSATLEVDFQYSLWKQDYEEAINIAIDILQTLKARELGGYRQYWNYEIGSIYNRLYLEGNGELNRYKANEYYTHAAKYSGTITWFRNLKIENTNEKNDIYNDQLSEMIDRIEQEIESIQESKRIREFEKEATETVNLLKDEGVKFERGMKKLGKLLGFKTGNSMGDADPDTWWILNDEYCMVTESKIYGNVEKEISIKHARQSSTHTNWIKAHEKDLMLSPNAEIINVFVSNSSTISGSIKNLISDVYYVDRQKIIEFAEKKLPVISEIRRKYSSEGDLLWRLDAAKTLHENHLTPKEIHEFFTSSKLKDLPIGK